MESVFGRIVGSLHAKKEKIYLNLKILDILGFLDLSWTQPRA